MDRSMTEMGSGAPLADRLMSLARDARLLELAVDGDGDLLHRVAMNLESALESAIDAESPGDLMDARAGIDHVLNEIVERGLFLEAAMSDMAVLGVLGESLMPVLTAVLSRTARTMAAPPVV
jgi:hypothetical protein